MNKKGFTLIEILFVLLLIALVVSLAVPVMRSVRYDIRNSQAKNALKKLLEARRSFYQNTKGVDILAEATFKGNSARSFASQACSQQSTSGIPSSAQEKADPAQLFACGFANWKDFSSIPYTFYFCDHWSATSHTNAFCQNKGDDNRTMALFAYVHEDDKRLGGDKYYLLEDGTTQYYVAVGWDGQIYDNLE